MNHRTWARCGAGLIALVVLGLASTACGAPEPTNVAMRGLELRLVGDDGVLHGQAVSGTRVVALPSGGFLLLVHEDVPNGGHLLRSADGTTWSAAGAEEAPPVPRIADIAANAGAVVAIGFDAPIDAGVDPTTIRAVRSTDGRTWSDVADPAGLRAVQAGTVVGSDSGFAAMGGSADTLAVSDPQGDDWTTERLAAPRDAFLEGLAPGDPGFVAWGGAGGAPVAWRLDHGTVDQVVLGAIQPVGMAWTGARGIATGTVPTNGEERPPSMAIETTDGGRTWSAIPADLEDPSTVQVVGAAGLLLVVIRPDDGRRDAHVLRPVGDIGWEEVSLEAPHVADMVYVSSVAVDGRRVVLVGNTVGTGGGGDRVVIWAGDLP